MQKFPEPPNSCDHWIENTYFFLDASGRPRVRFMRYSRLPFHEMLALVAAVSVTSNQRRKNTE